ncbi:hypothetical protein SASPL_152199 [Salvia splendens]|uniref:Shikimate O-hydroxycinnamoyltransferase n=1 Tax=Salvia splendens TaxID=180675 RepID=A0A8X8Z126_SALSN|nr:malonyl-coenzyme:anthocyanin 5-O-glucoside-6'''-O-malonyltransferase-like [Salvia splendens]KAG6387017.1 hypothetical protein SASPL_152199 [Salvia splendens]
MHAYLRTFFPHSHTLPSTRRKHSPPIKLRYSCCTSGDSVSLITAKSDKNLNYQRIADHFYECVPELPLATRCSDSVVFPVVALQTTLFAGQGICVGITNHHTVADGSSIVNFVKSWGCANRSEDEEAFHQTVGRYFPVFNRNLAEDHEKLDSISWKFVRNQNPNLDFSPSLVEFPVNRVRSTLLLTKNQVQNLKNHVYANTPNSRDVSSFTVISAYAWICALRSAAASDDDDEEIVYFSFAAAGIILWKLPNFRTFLTAVESIREATRRILHSDRGVVESADWPLDFRKNSGQCVVSVAGSPIFDVYYSLFSIGKYDIQWNALTWNSVANDYALI